MIPQPPFALHPTELRFLDVAQSGLHTQYSRCKVFVLAAHVLMISENKHDSGNNNDEHDIININSQQSKQQLCIHVRRIPLGGSPSLVFAPALGERARVPRRGHPAVLSPSESLLAEASR